MNIKENFKEYYNDLKNEVIEILNEEKLVEGIILELEKLVDYKYTHESNFNNADPTTRMKCFERWEIKEAVNDIIKSLLL